ncbi:MAG TPA: MscL family protein [Candidatus Saccharimonadales bacterium]
MATTKKTTTKREAATARAKAARERAAKLGGGHASGFMTFIREQGVVGLAVGLAIGTAAGASVKVIVDNLISPLVALMTRGVDLNSMKWVIIAADKATKQSEVAIGWGAIVSSLITLLATAFVIYLVIHIAKLDRMDKKKS